MKTQSYLYGCNCEHDDKAQTSWTLQCGFVSMNAVKMPLALYPVGAQNRDQTALGPAVQKILNTVLNAQSADPDTTPNNNNNAMVHCGKTKVFLTHAMVTPVLAFRIGRMRLETILFFLLYWELFCCGETTASSLCVHFLQLELLEERRSRVRSQKAFSIQCCWHRHQRRQRAIRTKCATCIQAGTTHITNNTRRTELQLQPQSVFLLFLGQQEWFKYL